MLEIKGIIAIDGYFDTTSFDKLNKDPKVLGIDLTATLSVDELAQEEGVDPNYIDIVPSASYWPLVAE